MHWFVNFNCWLVYSMKLLVLVEDDSNSILETKQSYGVHLEETLKVKEGIKSSKFEEGRSILIIELFFIELLEPIL